MDIILRSLHRCVSGALSNAVAVEKAGVAHTYEQLLHGAQAMRCSLEGSARLGQSKQHGRRIACLVDPGTPYVLSMWSTWLSGGIFTPLAPSHPPPALEHVISDSGASLLLVERKHLEKVDTICKRHGIVVQVVEDMLDSSVLSADVSKVDADQVQHRLSEDYDAGSLILYTSGTTGKPKGVLHTHRSLGAQVDALSEAWRWRSSDRILHALPLHHIHGLVNALLCPHHNGAAVEFMSFKSHRVWASLARGTPTVFMGVPTMYSHMIRTYEQASPEQQGEWAAAAAGLRLAVCGSAACPVPVMHAWEQLSGQEAIPMQPLLERYGMTEIGMALSNPYEGHRAAGTVGQPLPGVQVCISTLSASTAEDPSGQRPGTDRTLSLDAQEAVEGSQDASGEIRVNGPCLFKEYWQRPGATADAFDEEGFFRTGDTGDTVMIDGEEYYRVLGRTSVDIIKSGGFKISALGIENVLLEHPHIRGAAVLGIPDSMLGERIVCVCELEEDSDLTFPELVSWASDRLPPYELPRDMLPLPQIPRNAMGKVNKGEVRELFLDQTRSRP